MNLIIVGPQASGKGTQAKLLVQKLGLAYFEAGDILREKTKENSLIGKEIDLWMNQKGKLVPDKIMVQVVAEWLDRTDLSKGVIFDGFPRVVDQYLFLRDLLKKKGLRIDRAIYLKISRSICWKRLRARRICPKCDREFNLITRPPKTDELCDDCQVGLVQRQDDTPELIKRRLKTYEEVTKPLVTLVSKEGILVEIDGEKTVEKVQQDILKHLKKI